MSQKLKNFRDPGFGTVKSRLRGIGDSIKAQDKEIERRQRQIDVREKAIRKRFTRLESQLSELKGQGDFVSARLAQGINKNK